MNVVRTERRNPLSESVRVLGLYVRAQLILVAFEAVAYGIGFAFADLPLWPILAVMCAGLSLIPQFGTLIGIAIVLIIGLFSDLSWTQMALIGGVWLVVQALEGFWLQPKLMGRPLGLSPLAVFITLLLASFLLGPIGLLVAVPILAVGMVWYRHITRRSQ